MQREFRALNTMLIEPGAVDRARHRLVALR